MSQPFKFEISQSEIQHYISEGKTRTEICKLLDVSMNTLRKYIGRDPNRKPYTRRVHTEPVPVAEKKPVVVAPVARVPVAPVAPTAPAPVAPVPAAPVVREQAKPRFKRDVMYVVTLHGEYADYKLDMQKKTISIDSFVGSQTPIDADTFKEITREFMAIYQEIQTA